MTSSRSFRRMAPQQSARHSITASSEDGGAFFDGSTEPSYYYSSKPSLTRRRRPAPHHIKGPKHHAAPVAAPGVPTAFEGSAMQSEAARGRLSKHPYICPQRRNNFTCHDAACPYFHSLAEMKNVLGKTRLCKFWKANVRCPFGDRCTFSHGVSELRYLDNRTACQVTRIKGFSRTPGWDDGEGLDISEDSWEERTGQPLVITENHTAAPGHLGYSREEDFEAPEGASGEVTSGSCSRSESVLDDQKQDLQPHTLPLVTEGHDVDPTPQLAYDDSANSEHRRSVFYSAGHPDYPLLLVCPIPMAESPGHSQVPSVGLAECGPVSPLSWLTTPSPVNRFRSPSLDELTPPSPGSPASSPAVALLANCSQSIDPQYLRKLSFSQCYED